jgi:hypothetical protein
MILLFAIVFLWMAIGIWVDIHYSLKDLKPHYGEVVQLNNVIRKVTDKALFKEVERELHIKLDSDNQTYTFITTKDFDSIISSFSIGDSITLYTKPKKWGIFGLKKNSAINHLTIHGKIIIDYSKYKKSIAGMEYMVLIFSIGVFIFYISRLKKRLREDF